MKNNENNNLNTNNPDVNQEKVAKEEIYPADTTQQAISDQNKNSDKPDNATKAEQGTSWKNESRKNEDLDVPDFFSNPRRTSKKVPLSSQKKVQKAIKKAVLKSVNKVTVLPNKVIQILTIVWTYSSLLAMFLFTSGDTFIALVCSTFLGTFVSMGFQLIENSYYKRICKQLEVDGLLKAICLSEVRPHIIDKELSLNNLHRRDNGNCNSLFISVRNRLMDLPNAKHRNSCLEAWKDFENNFEEFLLRKQQEELTAGRPLF